MFSRKELIIIVTLGETLLLGIWGIFGRTVVLTPKRVGIYVASETLLVRSTGWARISVTVSNALSVYLIFQGWTYLVKI